MSGSAYGTRDSRRSKSHSGFSRQGASERDPSFLSKLLSDPWRTWPARPREAWPGSTPPCGTSAAREPAWLWAGGPRPWALPPSPAWLWTRSESTESEICCGFTAPCPVRGPYTAERLQPSSPSSLYPEKGPYSTEPKGELRGAAQRRRGSSLRGGPSQDLPST